jgi:transcriptional antiterminator
MRMRASRDDGDQEAAHIPLDSRQAGIARFLLEADAPASVESIAGTLGLTARMVRYNLPAVTAFLAAEGIGLVRRRGVGIWITTDTDRADAGSIIAELEAQAGTRVIGAADRQRRVLVRLLDRAPEPIHLADLEAELAASRPTVRRDARAVEPWLEEHGLHLQRMPGVGVVVRGSEIDVRKALLAALLDATTPAELLPLDLAMHDEILTTQLGGADDASMRSIASLYLAIVARRVRAGRGAELQSGQLRSLIDHPVADAATRIAAELEAREGLAMGQAEVAGITEFLLGFLELDGTSGEPEEDDAAIVDTLVTAAAARLHPSLADDLQLRRSLAEHLRRLRVRLRYGLSVSNPLDHEVRQRYPDVYEVARHAVAEVRSRAGIEVPPEEVGFLTMYIAGSLERNRLRPKVRIAVVCPAGMATAWILVSRLLAVFPQVDVTRVVSKADYEREPGEEEADLVVSTIPLEHDDGRVPSVIVSPLLREGDVRRLSRLLGEPTR